MGLNWNHRLLAAAGGTLSLRQLKERAMRRRLRWPIALCIAAMLLFCGLIVRGYLQRPLSPLEARLVGEWTDPGNRGGPTRIFCPDRSFLHSSGQYEGKWSIEDNRLTLEYWQPIEYLQPFRIPAAHDISRFLGQLRRFDTTYTFTWEIELGADDQTHTLIFPENYQHDPDGKWEWLRRPNP